MTNAPSNYCTSQCWYDNVLAVSPANASVVFVGGSAPGWNTLWRSLDGGTSWAEVSHGANGVNLHVDHHALVFTPDGSRLFAGNDGGIWTTTDITAAASSVNWTNLNAGLGTIQYYPALSVHPNDKTIGFGGSQDNGTHKYSGSLTWIEVFGGDGGWTAVDPVNPTYVYGEYVYLNPYVSSNGGSTFSNFMTSGLNTGDRCLFIAPLVIDPTQPQNLYLGSYRVYQTTNRMTSWTAISGDLTGGGGDVSTLAVAPTDSNTVYAGSSTGHVWVTATALAATPSWTEITGNLPVRYVSNFAVGPTDANTVYVALSGFKYGGDNGGHVYKCTSVPSCATWTDISGDLPNIPVNDVVVDPDIANTLYLATDVGVFATSNGGSNWTPLMNGLPHAAIVTSLKLHRPSRTLRAGTLGRGMWDLSVPASTTPSVPTPNRLNPPKRKP